MLKGLNGEMMEEEVEENWNNELSEEKVYKRLECSV